MEATHLDMKNVATARLNDLEDILIIDGDASRRAYVQNAIQAKKCLVVKDSNTIVGFLIYHNHFFDCTFISLIIVSPAERRKGYASSLIDEIVKKSSTRKIFSSTNQSNKRMQEVFKINGFKESGIIENLDEGDPEIIYFKSK